MLFQHTAARRRLAYLSIDNYIYKVFQHTAARRRLGRAVRAPHLRGLGFNTQPPEGGWGLHHPSQHPSQTSFNTQPPEGGWNLRFASTAGRRSFNTQPPEGGWV